MRLTALTATLASASLSSAFITGFSAPAYLAAGQPFSFNLTTESSKAGSNDVAVAWGFYQPTLKMAAGYLNSVGDYSQSAYLGPSKSNVNDDIVIEGTVPEELGSEQYFGKEIVMKVAVTSISNTWGFVATQGWNATLRVERMNGVIYVKSGERGWAENGNCESI